MPVDLIELVEMLRTRPGMILGHRPARFDDCTAMLQGHHFACGSLTGFKEFLVLRVDGGDNLVWWALVLKVAFPGGEPRPLSEEDEQLAVASLLDLAAEFAAEARSGGLGRILHEYGSWLRSQSWYRADLIRMSNDPPPEMLTVDEAATALGLSRRELFLRLSDLRLTPLRQGADVVFRRKDIEDLRSQD